MGTYLYAVENTGRPYGPMEQIPEGRWRVISRHTTLSAARKRMDAERADMRSVCGPGAWNDHFRIVAIKDRRLTYTYECDGDRARYSLCSDERSETVEVAWPAGTTQPEPPDLPGWSAPDQCSRCAAAEHAYYEARAMAEEDSYRAMPAA